MRITNKCPTGEADFNVVAFRFSPLQSEKHLVGTYFVTEFRVDPAAVGEAAPYVDPTKAFLSARNGQS